MSGTRFAIVAAMYREIAPLVKGWQIYLGNHQRFFERGDTVVVCGGIGPAAAQDSAEAIIARRNPEILVSAGYAGALSGILKSGDCLIPSEIVDASSGDRFMTSAGSGTLVSSTTIGSAQEKGALAIRFSADAVDMEAAAVARVARAHGCKFLAVKAISDELEFEMPPVDRFVSSAGEFQTAKFAIHTALHPSLWGSVRTLARNSRRASLTLGAALDHLIKGQDPAMLVPSLADMGKGVVR